MTDQPATADPHCTYIYPGGERCSLSAAVHDEPAVAQRHNYPPKAVAATRIPLDHPSMRVARNIVNQILDASGADGATRQRINDDCDQFTARLIDAYAAGRESAPPALTETAAIARRIETALAEHDWSGGSPAPAAHSEHGYDSRCAVCRGHLPTLAAVAADALTKEYP